MLKVRRQTIDDFKKYIPRTVGASSPGILQSHSLFSASASPGYDIIQKGRTESVQRRSCNHEGVAFALADRLPTLLGQLIRCYEQAKTSDTDEYAEKLCPVVAGPHVNPGEEEAHGDSPTGSLVSFKYRTYILAEEGHVRVEQHAGEKVGVLVGLYDQKVTLYIACRKDYICKTVRYGGNVIRGYQSQHSHFHPSCRITLAQPLNPSVTSHQKKASPIVRDIHWYIVYGVYTMNSVKYLVTRISFRPKIRQKDMGLTGRCSESSTRSIRGRQARSWSHWCR
jgi:hypothetical protein